MTQAVSGNVSAWSLLRAAYRARRANQGQRMGAALAFYSLFSMAPMLLIVIAIAGVALGHGPAQGMVLGSVEKYFGAESAQAVHQMIERVAMPSGNLFASAIGALAVILGAVGMVGELQSSLNVIWRVPARSKTVGSFLRTRMISLALIVGIGFLLLVSLGITVVVAAVGGYLADFLPFSEMVLQGFNAAASLLVVTLLFACMFKALPDLQVAWRDAWVGAGATALLFTLGNYFLGLYLGKIGVASSFGAAGSLVAIVAWAYYGAQFLYFGAELAHVYAEAHGPLPVPHDRRDRGSMNPSGEGALNFLTTLLK